MKSEWGKILHIALFYRLDKSSPGKDWTTELKDIYLGVLFPNQPLYWRRPASQG